MKIGLVVAIEMDSIFAYYKTWEKVPGPTGYDVYRIEQPEREIYVIHTGMGVIAAAAGTQYLITRYDVDVIVNFGVVGGLTAEMGSHRVCVVDRVVHYRYDCTEFMDLKLGQVAEHDSIFLPTTGEFVEKALSVSPELTRATCCSGDKFVGTGEEKAHLHEAFEGDVCDMESAGIVLTCEANRTPCLLLKAVADGLVGGARQFYEELQDAAFGCLAVADKIMSNLK